MSHLPLDSYLLSWSDLEREPWPGILIGNGASRAVWNRFAYESLLTVARQPHLTVPLNDREYALFETLHTRNFEVVLQSLGVASVVNRILAIPDATTPISYERVQQALIEAVRWVHPSWGVVPLSVLAAVRKALLAYESVYSTNYDLLIYWAVMAESHGDGFADCFYRLDGLFDVGNTEVWYQATRVLYLHGGIHLEGDVAGATRKRIVSGPGANLLATFQERGMSDGWLPLFVSEGTGREKEMTISRSEYLSFANEELAADKSPLVVFGHSLGEQDQHLARAIRTYPRRLAVGVLPGDDTRIVTQKGHFVDLFPEHTLDFFDASTHPLGHPGLHVESANGS